MEYWQPLFIVCVIYLFSYMGILLRLGLEDGWNNFLSPNETESGPLFVDFFSNNVGCFFMGIVYSLEDSNFLKRHAYLSDGLVSGTMGSLTTFSAWQGSASIKLVKNRDVCTLCPKWIIVFVDWLHDILCIF